MPVSVDLRGKLTHTPSVETTGLAGRWFVRRTKRSDPGDVVVIVGAVDVGGYGGPAAEVVVTCAEFGAVPDGWDGAVTSYDLDAFAEEYRELGDAERAALALEQAAESKAATQASAGKDSPWRRS